MTIIHNAPRNVADESAVAFRTFRLFPQARLLEKNGVPLRVGGCARDILNLHVWRDIKAPMQLRRCEPASHAEQSRLWAGSKLRQNTSCQLSSGCRARQGTSPSQSYRQLACNAPAVTDEPTTRRWPRDRGLPLCR
jgi:hypothetical protein